MSLLDELLLKAHTAVTTLQERYAPIKPSVDELYVIEHSPGYLQAMLETLWCVSRHEWQSRRHDINELCELLAIVAYYTGTDALTIRKRVYNTDDGSYEPEAIN